MTEFSDKWARITGDGSTALINDKVRAEAEELLRDLVVKDEAQRRTAIELSVAAEIHSDAEDAYLSARNAFNRYWLELIHPTGE